MRGGRTGENLFLSMTGVTASVTMMLTIAMTSALGLVVLIKLGVDILSPGVAPDWTNVRDGLIVASAALGSPFLIWRTLLLARQTQVQQERLHSDSFLQAVALLGSSKKTVKASQVLRESSTAPLSEEIVEPDLEVRVGAIYAISRISGTSDLYYWQAMETLTSYLRQNCAQPREYLNEADRSALAELIEDGRPGELQAIFDRNRGKVAEFVNALTYPREDIQATISVISGREGRPKVVKRGVPRRIRFKGACLQRADLKHAEMKGASLQYIRAEGADFRGANLSDVDFYFARLEGADFGDTCLKGANLCSANLIGANIGEDRAAFVALLNDSFGDACTMLPAGVMRPKHWSTELPHWQMVYSAWNAWRRQRGFLARPS